VTSLSPRTLHVANGTSTTTTLAAAGVPGQYSIWADVLHEGPVPAGISDDEMVEVRSNYLSAPDEGEPPPRIDPINDLRRWRAVIDDVESYDELVLWFEHDLFDQLNLIQILDRLSRASRRKTTSLICIGSFPGRQNFKGLGELNPPEIASLVPTRQPVGDAQYALAVRAWDAFRAPDPRAIERAIAGDTSPLPFLRAALQRFLQDFPWTRDGLSRTERRLMTLVDGGTSNMWAIFPRMHDDEDAFYIADGSFWTVALDLERASLVAVEARTQNPLQLPVGTIALTPLGRDVLSGRADRIARCGIDRWLGGVHLEGRDRVWRWDDGTKRIVP
jgi:hypothetical protein